jgi:hypothetical protein
MKPLFACALALFSAIALYSPVSAYTCSLIDMAPMSGEADGACPCNTPCMNHPPDQFRHTFTGFVELPNGTVECEDPCEEHEAQAWVWWTCDPTKCGTSTCFRQYGIGLTIMVCP